jgi:hypothetical protein
MTRFGPAGPFRPRATVPHQYWRMSREEIVASLMEEGFSRKMAERDADGFLAYRDGAKGQMSQEKQPRNDSVSGMSTRDRIRRVLGRGGSER